MHVRPERAVQVGKPFRQLRLLLRPCGKPVAEAHKKVVPPEALKRDIVVVAVYKKPVGVPLKRVDKRASLVVVARLPKQPPLVKAVGKPVPKPHAKPDEARPPVAALHFKRDKPL